MSKELEQRLLSYLDELENAVHEGGALAQQEIPLVIHEYLQWHFFGNVVFGVVWLLVAIGVILAARCSWRRTYRYQSESGDENLASVIRFYTVVLACFVDTMIFGLLFLPRAATALQIWIAPRVFLVEELSRMLGR